MEPAPTLADYIRAIRKTSGARRPMGLSSKSTTRPHYHLLRKFKGDVDLLIILNTKRCHYNCSFCDLPTKSGLQYVTSGDIQEQLSETFSHYRDSLDVIDRLTLSNEGSVFDADTMDPSVLTQVADAAKAIPALRRLVLETRPEFVTADALEKILRIADDCIIDVLVGFETQDERIRNVTLGKRQDRESLLNFLNLLSTHERTAVTSYVLVKPGLDQDDDAAIEEARATIQYLACETQTRGVPLSIRLNPMYIPSETRWGKKAVALGYLPPRLSDVLRLARWAEAHGVPSYVGLSTEGLAESGSSYHCRDDFSKSLLKEAIQFNSSSNPLGAKDFECNELADGD